MIVEANNIRMYSWSALLVALSGIYAYRICLKNKTSSYVYFIIFSLLAAYTHYFATFTIAFINLMLFVSLIQTKQYAKLKRYILSGIIEVLFFIPGMIVFIHQSTKVVKNYWIGVSYPWTPISIALFYFDLIHPNKWLRMIILIVEIVVGIYAVKVFYQNRKNTDAKVAIMSILVYFEVIIFSLIISIVRPIVIARYTFPMVSLLMFTLAYIMANVNHKMIYYCMIAFILFISLTNTSMFYQKIYSKDNKIPFELVQENSKDDDIFLHNNITFSCIYTKEFPTHRNIFFQGTAWDLDGAFKVMKVESANSYKEIDFGNKENSRIWLIEGKDKMITDKIQKDKIILQEEYFHPYSNFKIYITLLNMESMKQFIKEKTNS